MTPDCSSNPILGAKVNLLGSINVFEALKKNNIKFLVYASSAGVFGQKDHYYPFPETHYGAYKLAVEGLQGRILMNLVFQVLELGHM